MDVSTDSIVASGGFSGRLAGTGFGTRLVPGERREITLIVGTACCEPNDLYVPPTGAYEVVAAVPIRHRRSTTQGAWPQLVARGARLTLGRVAS